MPPAAHRVVSLASVVDIPIDRVIIGTRRRRTLGRLKSLAMSIHEHGLIHPILLRGDTLVAGHRRLEACRSLKWKTIPARQIERLTDDELRAIELEENTARENLNDFETSKARLAQIRQAEADLKAKAKAETDSRPKVGRESPRPRGGQRRQASTRAVAEETGISRAEQHRVERHVALGEQYPFMQRRDWLRHHVLDAGDQLDKLPEGDRPAIAALLDQDGIPPEKAIEMLAHAAEMPTRQRAAVIANATSDDEFLRRTAATKLADVPPPPDPGLLALNDAARDLDRAAHNCRSAEFRPRVATLAIEASQLLKEFRVSEQEVRRHVV